MARRRNPWVGIGVNAWMLGIEASTVIGLRTLKIAAGGPVAAAETNRMIQEKIDAAAELQTLAMTGGLGVTVTGATRKAVAHYRRKVRANRKGTIKRGKDSARNLGDFAMSKREEIAPNGDNRYIRRDDKGQISTSVEEGASLSAESRHKAKTDAKPGEGDRGDHHAK